MRTVITFGTFDLFHVGHLRILERAASLGDRLLVGVCTDEQSRIRKGVSPAVNFQNRAEIVGALKMVDSVFAEEHKVDKEHYIRTYGASVFAIGDDWVGQFDHLTLLCEVVYFPRTPAVSTTLLRVEICQTSGALLSKVNGTAHLPAGEALSTLPTSGLSA
jgi:choline-phosphate cytidylyltransferase